MSTPVMNLVARFATLPLWLLLSLLRPWQDRPRVQSFARGVLGPMLWVNSIWSALPVVVVDALAGGGVSWMLAAIGFVVVTLLLHSVISHRSEALVAGFARPVPGAPPSRHIDS